MSDFISISASSATLSGRPPAAVHAPEIEPGVGCDFDSYLLVPDNTLDDRIAAAKARLGEDVVHAAFGEGVVTGVEPDGVIVVRFAGDGSERKLMAEYAPVSRR